MIGRYLDALARTQQWEALDNILQAQSWITHALFGRDDGRCLLGHAGTNNRGGVSVNGSAITLADEMGLYCQNNRFDRLAERFGLERVVRAIKQRAGKHTRPALQNSETPLPNAAVFPPNREPSLR